VQLDPAVKPFGLLLGEAMELEHDSHLQLGGAEHLQGVLGLRVGEGELDIGMALAEAGERRREQRGARGGERRQAHAPPAHAGDRVQLGLCRGEPREHHVGVVDQRPARVRQVDAAAGAVDERGAGAALERGDLLGDGRLRVGERLGRGGEGAVLRDRLEDLQLLDVEHNPSLSKPAEVRI
jgi:hypothetical protein